MKSFSSNLKKWMNGQTLSRRWMPGPGHSTVLTLTRETFTVMPGTGAVLSLGHKLPFLDENPKNMDRWNIPTEARIAAVPPAPTGLFQHGPDGARQEDAEEGAEAARPSVSLQLNLTVSPDPRGEEETLALHESAGPGERTSRVRGAAGESHDGETHTHARTHTRAHTHARARAAAPSPQSRAGGWSSEVAGPARPGRGPLGFADFSLCPHVADGAGSTGGPFL